jgi:hypothetical protein
VLSHARMGGKSDISSEPSWCVRPREGEQEYGGIGEEECETAEFVSSLYVWEMGRGNWSRLWGVVERCGADVQPKVMQGCCGGMQTIQMVQDGGSCKLQDEEG